MGGVSPAPWDSLNLGANRGDSKESVAENFRRFCTAIGTDCNAVIKNRQVHSALVRPVYAEDIQPDLAASGIVEADGLVTDQPGLCLTVFSADCIPILFYDPIQRVIAAVHAGWRGTAAGIAEKAVEAMVSGYGCKPEQIQAAIGPGIGPCHFETHSDVPDALTDALGSHAAPLIHPRSNGKYQVDLKQANACFLRRAGLNPEHLAISDQCTACHPDEFWSHRLLGNTRGSMAAMIQLKTENPT